MCLVATLWSGIVAVWELLDFYIPSLGVVIYTPLFPSSLPLSHLRKENTIVPHSDAIVTNVFHSLFWCSYHSRATAYFFAQVSTMVG